MKPHRRPMAAKVKRAMLSSLKTVAIAAAVALLIFVSNRALRAQNLGGLPTRHSREAVTSGQARFLNRLPAIQHLGLAIMLPLNNEAELDNLLQQIYDPSSPKYRHYLSVEEFTARFGPTQSDYDNVVSYMEAHGLKVTTVHANRMVLDVEGPVSAVEKTFNVQMGLYQHTKENRTFYAADREPSVSSLRLWHVAGLDNFSMPKTHLRFAETGSLHTFTTGSGPGGTFLGSDIRKAYYGGTALTGTGQTIGLYGLNFNMSDVQSYFNNVGQSFNSSVVQTISINGYDTSCGSGCDDGEPVIDIIEAYSMAPGVSSIIEYEASNDVDTFNRMATDNIAKQLSASVGWLPADPSSDEPIFKEFAAQGQNLFASSDDSGAYSSSTISFYPADDPFIVSTGGTDLVTNGAGGSWQSESGWVGSGGGVSSNGLAIPSYQQLAGVINASNHGSTTLRNAPDLAMEANTDNFFCANGSCQGGVGGTSLSAPRWAGFLALVNQQAA